MRTIGLVSVARSDYGIYRPVIRALQADPQLELRVIASGMHLSPDFGLTVQALEADGVPVAERVEMLLASDSPAAISKSIGVGVLGFAQVYQRSRPDLLVVLGDRFEMYAAALAAVPFNIPIAHIHGGEVTNGAIDDVLRHSMTKMSHLHFVSAEPYGRRVIQLGEEPWRVVVSGAPALDHLHALRPVEPELFHSRYGVDPRRPFLLATYHPVTREFEQAEWQFGELLAALAELALPVLFTMANADTNGRIINAMIRDAAATYPWAHRVDNLGVEAYFSAMRYAVAMVGNSSSGIIEAASFELPVVNVGSRQHGRARGANVIDVPYRRHEILAGLRRALAPDFRLSLRGMANPYGDGRAAERIAGVLRTVPLDQRLLMKSFYDLPPPR
ncbi:MAG TPA: UDP-N-acetylglucosamine 2-epimerase [Chloroflexaceae bacterium]|nr:UDP-N-acetylglucosamine 2-epimerase [Chloroflexaceae bacterium]